MEIIEVKTLIDITNTNLKRPNTTNDLESNQYRNWTTFLQCIGLRCIISYDKSPVVSEQDIKEVGFGSKYKGKQAVWTFRFTPDRSDSYLENNNKIGLLINDLHEVPIIEKLNETINIPKAVFDLTDTNWCNTVVKILEPGN
jgi:hypothetical protein